MNDTLKTIASRFSCRDFSDRQIDSEKLMAIAEAGNQAPTSMNRQAYHITMLSNPQKIAQIETAGMEYMTKFNQAAHQRIMGRGGKLFYNAPAVAFIATTSLDSSHMELIDLGIVAQNIALAAHSLGVASCHCRMANFCFLSDMGDEFLKLLQFPQGYSCGYAVLLGYAKTATEPHTPNPDKITFID